MLSQTNSLPFSTGDVLLFGLAKEQHAITHPSSPVELVMIGDDVAVPRTQGKLVGRRGLAGTILAYKCAAAAAGEGKDLAECKEAAQVVGGMLGTIGAGLSHCHVGWRLFSRSRRLDVDDVIHRSLEPLRKRITFKPTRSK